LARARTLFFAAIPRLRRYMMRTDKLIINVTTTEYEGDAPFHEAGQYTQYHEEVGE
jgi:hypothetical protein